MLWKTLFSAIPRDYHREWNIYNDSGQLPNKKKIPL